ncbi:uncharacterized protein MELLADRAFT_103202 [Melampsora larici-populina 98AG31]|uniref:Uncharacterized protein n=1 Tax=Melampsora larici-populina (strain 98AG31 / pathotype 3-4-7) TaxID=747676 RepID=F4RAW3_MELLP|nr:uncharacterized protein MELLADRAFT_103202 [Melampsora larici-populina 98AG31]EGG10544.1 hypothetical protein MELLADRAFT_103202 [Melampsora larici-populina 98AG31]
MSLSRKYQSSFSPESIANNISGGNYAGSDSGNQSFYDQSEQSKTSSKRTSNSNQVGIFSQKIESYIVQYHQIHKPCVRHNNPKYHENPTNFTNSSRDQKEFIEKDYKLENNLLITKENVMMILMREEPMKFEKFLKFFEYELLKFKDNLLILDENGFEANHNQNQESFDD